MLYGENKMFGEEFLSAVYNLNLMESVKVVHIKCACLATNLVTDKVVDGISRLLTKSDVDKLKGNKERTIAISDMIDEAMRILDQALSDGYLSQEVSDSALAKFMVRCMLLITDKQKTRSRAHGVQIRGMYPPSIRRCCPQG